MCGRNLWSSWLLPLLLLSLCFWWSSSITTCLTRTSCKMHEFNINIGNLGQALRNCSKNCSAAQTDKVCRCLNLSATYGDQVFPENFIRALRSLRLTSHSENITVKGLVKALERRFRGCNDTEPWLRVKLEPVEAPKSLWGKLSFISQQINSACANRQ